MNEPNMPTITPTTATAAVNATSTANTPSRRFEGVIWDEEISSMA
jgi:hypothetical protein